MGRLGDLCSVSKVEWAGLRNPYTLDLMEGGVVRFCSTFCPIPMLRIHGVELLIEGRALPTERCS